MELSGVEWSQSRVSGVELDWGQSRTEWSAVWKHSGCEVELSGNGVEAEWEYNGSGVN